MTSTTYRQTLRSKIGEFPELTYLAGFLDDSRMGNSACQNRSTLVRNAIVLDRKKGSWNERDRNQNTQSWEPCKDADGQAIIIDYLDSEAIQYLGSQFEIDPQVFQTHIAGCEQHYTGDWAKNELTSAPCLRSTKRSAHFVSFDYRRPYVVRDDTSIAIFNHNRIQSCSLLRSYHWAGTAEALFEHERYTIAWFPGIEGETPGALVCICDPVIDLTARGNLLEASVAAVKALPPDQRFDESIVCALQASTSKIAALWNEVAFHMDHQISALEDQLEHDFWDKPQNPISILHQTQRASRRLATYRDQQGSMRTDLAYSAQGAPPGDLDIDMIDIQDKLNALVRRADKVVNGLLASIAIGEGAKASSLTAIALWFAPLSLSISLVSIDGRTELGGRKYWIMASIAVPLLFVVIAIANTSDRLMEALGRRRRGRALMKLFKPETKLGRRHV